MTALDFDIAELATNVIFFLCSPVSSVISYASSEFENRMTVEVNKFSYKIIIISANHHSYIMHL